jgi:hypothetical protein
MPRLKRTKWAAYAAAKFGMAMVIFPLLSRVASATPIAAATASETPMGSDFQYSLVLKNNSATPGTAATAIGTFWFGWIPGEDFLETSPLSVSSPTGWQDQITHGGSNDGYAIQWTTTSPSFDLAAGGSLSGFSFTTVDGPGSVFGNSFFYPTTPTRTSFAYEGAPFSDAGSNFVPSVPEPASVGLFALFGAAMLTRRRRDRQRAGPVPVSVHR